MTNQTKMLLGLGVVGVAGYLYWKSTQPKAFANQTGGALTASGKCKGKTKGGYVANVSTSGEVFYAGTCLKAGTRVYVGVANR
jgi:hypothetical protein